MRIGALDKFTLIDFPGHVSAIIFTQGCNFRCPFCHNPELVIPEQFTESIPFDEVLRFLKSRRRLLDGVEFTGGEPTLQPDLLEKMRTIKELGYAIKLDSNGTNPDMVKQAISEDLVDYVAMDVKGSLERYNEVAGVNVDTEKVARSIDLIKNSAPDYEFRTTLIKGFHDVAEMEKIGALVDGAKRYFLQQAHYEKTVKSGFSRPLFGEQELLFLCKTASKYVQECQVR